jgi:hypothetical protein
MLRQNGQMATDVGSSLAKLTNTVTMLQNTYWSLLASRHVFCRQMTHTVIAIRSCQNLKWRFQLFFPWNVANLAIFSQETPCVEVATCFFHRQVAKFRHNKKTTLVSIPVQHGTYFPAFNPVTFLVKPQYRVKPALCNVRRKGNVCSSCSSIRNSHYL